MGAHRLVYDKVRMWPLALLIAAMMLFSVCATAGVQNAYASESKQLDVRAALTTQATSSQFWHIYSDGDPFTLGNSLTVRWENVSSTVAYYYRVEIYNSNGTRVVSERYPNSGTYSANSTCEGHYTYGTTTSQPSGNWSAKLIFYNSSGSQLDNPGITFFVKDTDLRITSHNLGDITMTAFESKTLSVSATGSNLKYQWYWNTTGSLTEGNAISGATGSSYTISNVPVSYSGRYYQCRVSNNSGAKENNYLLVMAGGTGALVVNPAATRLNLGGEYFGTYDGSSHTVSCTVSGPSNYTIYYSTATALDSSNYSSQGSTIKPSIKSGYAVIHVFVKSNNANYSNASGSVTICIKPKATVQNFSGAYDGNAHASVVNCQGGKVYYRTDGAFPYDSTTMLRALRLAAGWDPESCGVSATPPSITNAGTQVAYYLVVPNEGTAMIRDPSVYDDKYNSVLVGQVTTRVNKANPTLRFASSSMTRKVSDGAFTNTLTKTTDGTVTFSSSNTSVATVNSSTGQVTPRAEGATTITANASAGNNYNAGSASYTLTVKLDLDDPYNLGDETYSFENYSDDDSDGHCFGMSITSLGYHSGALDIGIIGGNASTPLYSFELTQAVMKPICFYQNKQGSFVENSIVAGGSYEKSDYRIFDMASDWPEIVDYVRNHDYDDAGLLELGFWKRGGGGHSVAFLRYQVVGGQERLYAYDNNRPYEEVYFYRDSSGRVFEKPDYFEWGALDSIELSDARTYFDLVRSFDSTHVVYMPKNAAFIPGYSYSYLKGESSDDELVMYEIPAGKDVVTIVPKKDNASFTYADREYSFGKVTNKTRGELRLTLQAKGAVGSSAAFTVYEADSKAQGIADGKTAVAGGATYKVASNAAGTVYYHKAPKSKKSVTIPATVKINGKVYKVVGISKGAFKGAKAKTVTVKTVKLSKKSVKGCFKGAKKIRTVKVKVGSKKANKKYGKKYKKIFTKKNAGKKAIVK